MSEFLSPVLEFPAVLHGQEGPVRREVMAEGRRWARQYLKTGSFILPQKMLQVPPGEVLLMNSVAEFEFIPRPRWRIHMFGDVFMSLADVIPAEVSPRAHEDFESFCLSTPWGALYHAVSPPPPRSAERMAHRLAALLRHWDALQAPRYAFWPGRQYSLDELVKDIYGMTLEAWCPGGPASVRDQLALMVERMARATREDCLEAVRRVIPPLVRMEKDFKHPEVLGDPDLQREQLAALPPDEFENLSSGERYSVNRVLFDWDRALSRN